MRDIELYWRRFGVPVLEYGNRLECAAWRVYEVRFEGVPGGRGCQKQWTHMYTYWTPCLGETELFMRRLHHGGEGGTWKRVRMVIEEWQWTYDAGDWERQEWL